MNSVSGRQASREAAIDEVREAELRRLDGEPRPGSVTFVVHDGPAHLAVEPGVAWKLKRELWELTKRQLALERRLLEEPDNGAVRADLETTRQRIGRMTTALEGE